MELCSIFFFFLSFSFVFCNYSMLPRTTGSPSSVIFGRTFKREVTNDRFIRCGVTNAVQLGGDGRIAQHHFLIPFTVQLAVGISNRARDRLFVPGRRSREQTNEMVFASGNWRGPPRAARARSSVRQKVR